MKSEEKIIVSLLSLSRRSICLFALLSFLGLLVVGCSISLDEMDNGVSPKNGVVEDHKVLTSSYALPNNNAMSLESLVSENATVLPSPVLGLAPLSSGELISALEQVGLWSSKLNIEVPHLIIDSFPSDLVELDVDSKKRVFFHSLLPVVMVAIQEVRTEREKLQAILEKFAEDPKTISFADGDTSWQKRLLPEEVQHVGELTSKYRNTNAAQLLKRVDVVPVSLILAQGAIESSWGTSRFASLGNNLFGMWTWGRKGIVPLGREEGKKHKVAAYDSIIESVRAYILTINRLSAYEHLRDLRLQTADPIILSQGLLNYSEKREAYVADLQKIISYNRLHHFDSYILASL